MPLGMPKFAMPPVVETLLAVQFDPLIKMHITDYGLFWLKIRDSFPIVQEQPTVPAIIEPTSAQPMAINPIQWRIGGELPLPRAWFRSVADTTAGGAECGIQLQSDRFMQNWVRAESNRGRYPSYDSNREHFLKYFGLFAAFTKDHEIGILTPNQCEITYVNRISIENDLDTTFRSCFPSLTSEHSTKFLPGGDRVGHASSFPISGDNGRLHVLIQGPVRLESGATIIDFRLTARGRPAGASTEQIMAWLDLGREWVVKGFHCLTSKEMHQKWGYTDE